jgi:CRP-like cAMP-binding protein
VSDVYLLKFSREDFLKILEEFPEIEEEVKKLSMDRE